ncbi:hypothetical protein NOVOSPHI9U_310076 [Novosphingobium sp. 9U]|nr:hypothetical protein NOVOSPHI9U_310076 [Novosphingobium sp. 9U]
MIEVAIVHAPGTAPVWINPLGAIRHGLAGGNPRQRLTAASDDTVCGGRMIQVDFIIQAIRKLRPKALISFCHSAVLLNLRPM